MMSRSPPPTRRVFNSVFDALFRSRLLWRTKTPSCLCAIPSSTVFRDQSRLVSSCLRFQENYESPVFKGKVFTRDEFLDWHARSRRFVNGHSGTTIENTADKVVFRFHG